MQIIQNDAHATSRPSVTVEMWPPNKGCPEFERIFVAKAMQFQLYVSLILA
jgi:hypothetical protein